MNTPSANVEIVGIFRMREVREGMHESLREGMREQGSRDCQKIQAQPLGFISFMFTVEAREPLAD